MENINEKEKEIAQALNEKYGEGSAFFNEHGLVVRVWEGYLRNYEGHTWGAMEEEKLAECASLDFEYVSQAPIAMTLQGALELLNGKVVLL